jgi:hypothetical protein
MPIPLPLCSKQESWQRERALKNLFAPEGSGGGDDDGPDVASPGRAGMPSPGRASLPSASRPSIPSPGRDRSNSAGT